MPIRKNISRAGATFAAEAQRHFNELRGALHSARESFSHLKRMIGIAKIRQPRGRTKTVRSDGLSDIEKIAVSGLGELISGNLSSNSLPSSRNFYRSASQTAAKLLDEAVRGQRIR